VGAQPLPDADLVAQIYEAAALPGQWPAALEALAAKVGAQAAALKSKDPLGRQKIRATERAVEGYADFLANGAEYPNFRTQRGHDRLVAGFIHDLEISAPEEHESDPIYQRFLKPHGFAWTSGTLVPLPTGDVVVFDIHRAASAGAFSRRDMRILDLYRPHLIRAALLCSRLRVEDARTTVAGVEAVGLPAASITDDGRVLAATAEFEGLAPRVTFRAFDRISLMDRHAGERFGDAILQLQAEGTSPSCSIPVQADGEHPPLVLHVLPLRGVAADVFSHSVALVVATPVVPADLPVSELLHGLFDLTPAESRLAGMLASGLALAEMSQRVPASIETLRSQLKSVMHKTGTRRQVDLVRLLLAARPIGGRDSIQ
jgi:DNA-binding CsgD family transcriptional regulator